MHTYQRYTKKAIFTSFLLVILVLMLSPINVNSNNKEVERLNREITEKRNQMEILDAEIQKQRTALNAVSGQSKTLQQKVNQLEQTRKKLETDIRMTRTEIERAELTIEKLNLEIREKNKTRNTHTDALAELLRRSNQMEQVTVVERFLGFENMADFWIDLELTNTLQNRLRNEITELLIIKKELEEQESQKSLEIGNLAKQVTILAGETEVVASTRQEQATLLQRTKNEEAEYQRILSQKMLEKKAFEDDMMQMESQLNFLIDTNSYPAARHGILSWPLDNIRVTQQFGGTQFAAQNPHIYGRPFHPGTDYAAPVGTRVKSVYGGTVKALGNTDNYPGCFAWGRWLLIDHDNGLSSLYAHLSSNLVQVGQRVERGEVVALSGNTGFSTGPHLHLTIYASQGVRVGTYTGTGGCGRAGAIGPFADLDAYLDPMLYLPTL